VGSSLHVTGFVPFLHILGPIKEFFFSAGTHTSKQLVRTGKFVKTRTSAGAM
jgi:hypothetical protein